MIIGLLGFINSGKGTLATQLVEEHGFKQESFANSLKDACSAIFDWPRKMLEGDTTESREWREVVDPWWSEKLNIPCFSPRFALQYIGTDVLRNNFHQDLWFMSLHNRVRKNLSQNVVISDVRFPNELDFISQNDGLLIKINRGKIPEWYDIAAAANKGDEVSRHLMSTNYAHIHQSEWAWAGAKVDFEVNNDGTLEDLKYQIKNIISKITP